VKILDHVNNLKNKENYKYTYVISEIGVNHNGDINTALDLIDASHDAGCDAVKFQKRNLHNNNTF
jgi:sialic acid synthase SpsE